MMHGFWFDGAGMIGWVSMIVSMLFPLLAAAGLFGLIIWAVIKVTSKREQQLAHYPVHPSGSPKEILQVRYANGEINRKEYQQMLADLK